MHPTLGARAHRGVAKQAMLVLEAIMCFDKIIDIKKYFVQQSFFIFVQHSGKV
jgi:hypothetical protein